MAGRGLNRRGLSFVVMTLVYLAALAIAGVTANALADLPLWQRILAADIAATAWVWAAAVALDNTSVYDPYWSVAPLPIALFAWSEAGGGPRMALASLLLALWGARLTWNFARGWTGFGHEDWRYVAYRRFGTVGYWLLSLFGLMMMPTILVYLGCLPVILAADSAAPLGLWDGLGLVLGLGFLLLETVSDEQLKAFRASRPPEGSFLKTGLWAWSRHPNYLGELGFWWGIACFGLAVGAPQGLAGAISITLLFWFISVPLIDKRMNERRPDYAEHCKAVPRLFPGLPW